MGFFGKAWQEISADDPERPPWKHRRRLIYGAYGLGVLMVLFGMLQFLFDTQAGTQAIVGGVSLITIIVSAYTGFSAWQDTRFHQHQHFTHSQHDYTSDG
jgi:uncharacterized membrane protein YkgB